MTIDKLFAFFVVFSTGVFCSATAVNAGSHCARVGVNATAVTKEVSTVIAKEGLYQSIAFSGRKGRGSVSVKCKYVGVLTTCTARQIACK